MWKVNRTALRVARHRKEKGERTSTQTEEVKGKLILAFDKGGWSREKFKNTGTKDGGSYGGGGVKATGLETGGEWYT